MSAGRTTWWPKDAAWHRRELIVELGEEFETAGPFVIDVLCAWAQEQRAAGEVRGGFKTLGREAFVTPSYARSIIERAAEIGALDDLKIDDDGRRFSCRISGWQADQARGRAAVRMAQKRANVEDSEGDTDPVDSELCVTEPNTLRDVTHSALPNLTKEEELPPNPQMGEPTDPLLPPVRPKGNRDRDHKAYKVQLEQWVGQHFPGRRLSSLEILIGFVRDQGHEPTPAAIREWASSRPNFALLIEEEAA